MCKSDLKSQVYFSGYMAHDIIDLSGTVEDIRIIQECADKNGVRARSYASRGAFHSPMMSTAVVKLKAALDAAPIAEPDIQLLPFPSSEQPCLRRT